MTTAEQQRAELLSPRHMDDSLPKLRWTRIFAISIFWFALNFHWAALGTIILPSQVFKLVGDAHKGGAVAFVLIPGAFVSLIANPLFGWISDQTHGRLARWGRRRPYILLGTLVNVAGLIWMATAPDIPSLALAYMLVQFASNAAQGPFHALLPDVVPQQQRGTVSGIMGVLMIAGSITGTVLAGFFISASKPLSAYRHDLWIAYGIIIAIILAFMLITIIWARERPALPILFAQETTEISAEKRRQRSSWLKGSWVSTVAGTTAAALLVWGVLWFWNRSHPAGVQIGNDVQQVILEVVVTIGMLRLFDFRPRRDSDFAWVLVTRFLMMMGIATLQNWMQYYMHDVIGVADPEFETAKFLIIGTITSIASTLVAGWLSDRFGRKRLVYVAGVMMAMMGITTMIAQSLVHSSALLLMIILAEGAIFGIGFGAYQSVDWALVADVLPSRRTYARDMGVWNISLSLPQVIAPVIAGPLIDTWTQQGTPVIGYQLLFAMAVCYCLIGTVTIRYIRGVKR